MKRTPKILFVLHNVLGHRTYTTQLERALAERNDIDYRILAFSASRLASFPLKRFNVATYEKIFRRIDPIIAYRTIYGLPIRGMIRDFQPHIVHFGPHLPASAIAFELSAPKFTATLDCTRACMERSLPKHVWSETELKREAALFQRASRLYPWSTWAADSLTKDCGIPGNRINVMPPSTDTARFQVAGHDRGDKPAKIIFIGNDFLRKGGDRLHGWATGPLADICELHIVSADPAARVKGKNVVFHGRVSNDDLVTKLLPEMHILCHPTRSDMSAYVAIEAASAGLPCVASAIGGIPDIIEDGVTGFLIPVDDNDGFVNRLRSLIVSNERCKQMGKAAASRAKSRFDSGKNFQTLFQELEDLIF